MNQTTEAKNYICVNCKLVTNHKQKRCIQCGCQTHEPTAADVTYPADTRHEAMTTEAKDKTDMKAKKQKDETVTVNKEAYEILLKRSNKLKSIEDALEKAYATDEYGETAEGEDLCSIGESVCHIMGYL